MSQKLKLQVDLADPVDLREKVAQAEEIWTEKRRAMREAEKEAIHWAGLVTHLKQLAGIPVDTAEEKKSRPSPMQDAVVRIVEREGRAMRPVEVARRLKTEGREVKSTASVNAALYSAAEAGRLRRPSERYYAPRLKKAKKVKAVVKKKTAS